MRGIAVLMVVFVHGFWYSYGSVPLSSRLARVVVQATKPGWLGVQLFFVLSGILITGILVDSRGRRDYFRRFYNRRVLRIFP